MPALLARIVLLGVIVPLNIPIYRWAWRLCFGTMEEFEVCVRHVTQLHLVSLFRFEFPEASYARFKVLLFLGICVGVIALEFVGLWLVFVAVRDIWSG